MQLPGPFAALRDWAVACRIRSRGYQTHHATSANDAVTLVGEVS